MERSLVGSVSNSSKERSLMMNWVQNTHHMRSASHALASRHAHAQTHTHTHHKVFECHVIDTLCCEDHICASVDDFLDALLGDVKLTLADLCEEMCDCDSVCMLIIFVFGCVLVVRVCVFWMPSLVTRIQHIQNES